MSFREVEDAAVAGVAAEQSEPDPSRGTSVLPATMRAVTRDRYGSADVVCVRHVPVPTHAEDEVMLRVAAAGLDRGTWHLMEGRPYAARAVTGLRRPRVTVLGREVAGVVSAVGSAVRRLTMGDRVFGVATGSFAEYAVAREEKLVPMPDDLGFAEASVLPISGATALQAVDCAGVGSGSKVLVIGASGGVGGYAVQIAKARGAEVCGVSRAAKAEYVLSLGADRVIAYDTDTRRDDRARYDVIIDTGGDTPVAMLRRMLGPHGMLVIVGGEGGDAFTGMGRQVRAALLSPFIRQRLTFIVNRERRAELDRLRDLVESGAVRPTLTGVFALEQTADAIRRLAAGQLRGKVAIVPTEPAPTE